jgi:hypothetical protein
MCVCVCVCVCGVYVHMVERERERERIGTLRVLVSSILSLKWVLLHEHQEVQNILD